MEFLTPWLDSEELGQFVTNVLQQVARKQSANLNQKRIDFLYQQQEMTTSKVTYHPSTPRIDNAMILSTRIQQNISDNTLLISIWMKRDTSYVIALDKDEIRAHQQPTPPLLKLVKAFNKSYKQLHGYKLFQKLLAPYLNRHYDNIVLVVNGPLQNTAFAALSTNPNEQTWLGDKYLLRSLPRAARMLNPVKPKSEPVKILVLDASSVPGREELSATEIDTIIGSFASNQIANEKLTKKNLMENLPQYPVAHFAGHSEINHEFPDFSHLALYEDKVYLLELEQLPLDKVRLIVLGSCESAARADSNSNNQFSSLQESLLSAGAESVLANLFPVDDRIASELLSHFYKLLAQGADKDRALQQAQQLIRTNNPNPKDWAGFVLSGSKLAL
jgi:CHAT domain-containing protein